MKRNIPYKGLESAMIGDAIRKLPKVHDWRTVRLKIDRSEMIVVGYATCLKCNITIYYYDDWGCWVISGKEDCPENCNGENKNNQAPEKP